MIGLVKIEQDALIGPGVQIPSGPNTHGFSRLDIPIRTQTGHTKRVIIGRDSWVGGNSVILNDIGPQTVIERRIRNH